MMLTMPRMEKKATKQIIINKGMTNDGLKELIFEYASVGGSGFTTILTVTNVYKTPK